MTRTPTVSPDTVLATLALEEKVAQLLMPTANVDEHPEAFVEAFGAGGVLLSRKLSRDPDELHGFVRRAQHRSLDRAGLPLLIAADQEGGNNALIRDRATQVPSNMGLGATFTPTAAREAAAILATELRAVGVNWDFAPVVDVNNNAENPVIGVRSFGDDAETVAEFAAAAVRGFQENHVIACAKHFPGHGDTTVDSHVALPRVDHERARLDELELVPFRAAIAAGVESVMTSHVLFPAIDPERVVTLSRAALEGLLRGELGFRGLVVTDALEMRAIADAYSFEDATIEALAAGSDVVLTGYEVEKNVRIHRAVVDAVRAGRIPVRRIDESLARVVAAKQRVGAPEGDPATVRSPAMQHRALELARRTITLVRDDERALPIPTDLGDRLVVVSFIASAATKMETWTTTPNELGMQAAARAKGALDIQIADPAAGATRERILRAAERAAVVVVATLNAVLDPSQVSLLEAIRDRSRAKIVVVATRMPYDLVRMPWARTFVAAYTSVAPVMAATAEVLFGERRAPGRLPVAIPGLYPRGHRLS